MRFADAIRVRREGAGDRRSFMPMLLFFVEDMAMRTTLDFSPLFRTGIGFDRVFDALDTATRVQPVDNWPPYDIAKTSDDSYRISIAVAGFEQADLDVTFQSNLLTVTGKKQETDNDGYLHRGIAGRPFEHRPSSPTMFGSPERV